MVKQQKASLMQTIAPILVLLLSALPALASAQTAPVQTPPRELAPASAKVYFQAPQDGDRVRSPFVVRFGLSGMGIAPAGIAAANTGHHHLLINVTDMPPEAEPLPATESIRHFGLGQTETELSLPPGRYTLQLVLGDWLHRPHNPPVRSEVIAITVE
jgi:hypothetical protein